MPNITHSIQIDVPPDRVYPLISSGSGFAQWWTSDVAEDAKTRVVHLGLFNRATFFSFRPLQIETAGQVEWLCQSGKEWEGTKLIFDLSPKNGHTLLRFTHADWEHETDYFVSCTTLWGELMFRLKAVAEGRGQGPLFANRSPN